MYLSAHLARKSICSFRRTTKRAAKRFIGHHFRTILHIEYIASYVGWDIWFHCPNTLLCWYGLTLIPAWLNNYVHAKVRDPITSIFFIMSTLQFHSHWCVRKPCMPSLDGMSPVRHQVIIWTNAGLLLIGTFGTSCIWKVKFQSKYNNFHSWNEFKISSKWRVFCSSCNVVTLCQVPFGYVNQVVCSRWEHKEQLLTTTATTHFFTNESSINRSSLSLADNIIKLTRCICNFLIWLSDNM